MMKKTYKVAEHSFSIEAEKDFPFWTLMEECYGPFETDDTETSCLFKMLVDESVCCENKTLIYSNADEESEGFVVYSVYKLDDDSHYFELRQPFSSETNACLSISADYSHAVLNLSGSKWNQWQTLNTAVNLCYYLAAIRQHTLLLHASAVEYKGKAYLFLGKSGTGKSTHSRMWQQALDGVTLINDDHPIVRMYNGEIIVYGSPWSGKTHCYKNMSVPLGGIIRIIRAPYNKATRLSPIHSYASVMPSCGGMVWEKEFADNRDATIQKIISHIPCWNMECLPNEDAAKECSKVVTEVWKVD